MYWVPLVLVSAFCSAMAVLLQKSFVMKSDPIESATFFQILATVFIAAFAIIHGLDFSGLQNFVPNLVVMPFIYAGVNYFFFKALKLSEASEVTLIGSFRSLLVAVGSTLLLSERLSTAMMIGTLLIIASVFVVFFSPKSMKVNRGHIYAIIGSALLGLGFINDTFILTRVDVASYEMLAFLLPGILMLLFKPSSLRLFANRERILKMTVTSAFYSGAALLLFYAYHFGGLADQVYPISQSYVIITVILAAIFLRERDDLLKKAIATLLVLAGIAFLILT
ncbi:MAG: DMT family transporter [Candidatus Micrarchaeota archaeon]|nr:DMT family transporter [Candidatus Micrarchaeota archaeon]